MRFENPVNGYIEETNGAPLWCLLFGCIYFAVKGIWTHAFAALLLAIVTAGLSWLIYPFFATQIVRTHYLRRGWIEVNPHQQEPIITGAAQTRNNTGRNVLFVSLIILFALGAAGVWHTGIHEAASHAENGVPECRKDGPPAKLCFLKFGQVSLQLENNSNRTVTRAMVLSDDMKRDATDFALATGFLMLSINPKSTSDQRGSLLKTLMTTSKSGRPTKWSGYVWRLDYTSNDAIRIVAERN